MFPFRWVIFALLLARAAAPLYAQQTQNEQQKREEFLDARGEHHAPAKTPEPKAAPPKKAAPKSVPKPTPKPAPKPTPKSAPKAKPDSEPKPDSKPAQKTTGKASAKAKSTTKTKETPSKSASGKGVKPKPREEEEPAPKPASKAAPNVEKSPEKTSEPAAEMPGAANEVHPKPRPLAPVPSQGAPLVPNPQAGAVIPLASVTVEKSGFEASHELEPVPGKGWFTRWKYLPKSVQTEIDNAPVLKHRWRYVVVHNSGTRQGNAKAFDYYHLHVRKMVNGLAYQFVIGNGTSSGDGEIEIGNRWTRQINGGHVHSDYLNNISLGICLVGDLNLEPPTQRQLDALDELIRYLRLRIGKTEDKPAMVKAHREINPPRWPTDCPGTQFPYQWLHGKFD